ncbi:hypothetical protein P7C70_g1328, partial [Phenoliferia sp. Uapishka_3]
MANADFLVAWPTSDSSDIKWTLSHRQSTGEVMPTVASNVSATETTEFFTLVPTLSTTDHTSHYTVVTYLRLLNMPSDYPTTAKANAIARDSNDFIFASSTVKPTGNAENAVLTQHDQAHAKTSLDLSTPIILVPTTSGNSSSGDSASSPESIKILGRTTRDKYLISHAVIGTVAVLFISPIAILVARLLRSHRWIPAHAALNSFSGALIVTTFAIGYRNIQPGEEHFRDTHSRVGLALFILILCQLLFGVVAHRTSAKPDPNVRLPTLSEKSPMRIIHIVSGLAILGLGLANVHRGLEEYEEQSDGRETIARGVFIVYFVIVAVIAALYAGGWVNEFLGGNRPAGPAVNNSENEKLRVESNSDTHRSE